MIATTTWRLVPILTLIVLAGCKDQKKPAAAGVDPAIQHVRDAAEQDIQSAAPATAKVRFRGVQVYTQAQPGRYAVCGQVSPFADDANIFVPFVSVVTGQSHGDWTQYQFDHRIGTTTSEASRVYAALVTYCYENGGPSPSPDSSVASVPPLPDAIPNPQVPGADARAAPDAQTTAPITVTAAPTAASGSVTMRQNGNLHADPHGASTRVIPAGTSLRVFGQAPGGWYQVGDTAPFGWVHESMVDRH